MTPAQFRKLALAHPGAVESSHMGHPDFRGGPDGRIFASLGPEGSWGMVMLDPAQQESLLFEEPEVYRPAAGAWGRRGATLVTLRAANAASVRSALAMAFGNVSTKRGRRRGKGAGPAPGDA